jgi:hypothetical protein
VPDSGQSVGWLTSVQANKERPMHILIAANEA